jgi:hypothetical protein
MGNIPNLVKIDGKIDGRWMENDQHRISSVVDTSLHASLNIWLETITQAPASWLPDCMNIHQWPLAFP